MEFIKFWATANRVAAKRGASLEDEGAEAFVRTLFDQFKNHEGRLTAERWLAQSLENSFVSMDEPPKWVGEPFWPFCDGAPMLFFHQFTMSTSATHMQFPLGDTLYVFGAKKPRADGSFSVAYRIVAVDEEGCRSIPRSGDIVF